MVARLPHKVVCVLQIKYKVHLLSLAILSLWPILRMPILAFQTPSKFSYHQEGLLIHPLFTFFVWKKPILQQEP